ncbi:MULTISPECIES: HyaD/HybD family hydrogenase maturation endopeptidase [Citrifermentans]|uniref:Periplasmically oriented, membrane-bound [NiFe]-hydrogenase maturation protease n=1 Tax=Citrifermentans bemidjiense (strain ATCC BAA-1014 / DSM 16622 / JCM 12645 / Bem) TaxID=404380 RepID=B5E8X3_CITBB|nr:MULTISPECIES: HyaD/HybD family hydrogenase maturation endopeptidase [Citrifermentans]ACH40137.1 periplasmically oriented, membrane-bound [NiFe]-hydrogenase maturation protease [Citrifermentans bemidjiense Bem]
MQVLIYGAGNLILSDEGFGVHFVRHMEEVYRIPENVELYDGGTLGIMVHFKFEEADRVILVDVVQAKGEPGDIFRYEREDIMLKNIPVKMSPHQIGLQEMLLISEMRDAPKPDLTFFGIVAGSLEPGDQLTPPLKAGLEKVAKLVVEELNKVGIDLERK